VTDIGKYYGGMQNYYMSRASVRWDERIVYNEIFIDEITRSGEKLLKKSKKKTLERILRLNIEQMTATM